MLIPSLESGGVLISRAVASQVPSALRGLTSVFGMGTGGALLLSSPECFGCALLLCRSVRLAPCPACFASRCGFRLRTFKTAQWKVDLQRFFSISLACASLSLHARFLAYRFRSSCRPISIGKLPDCSAFTADLSPDRLSGVFVLAYWNLLLEVGFTLRCLQRLSTPHFASQLCRWHDNCCTRDASTPVLSY